MTSILRKIKKYTNRKLYDIEKGEYVSMLGVSDQIVNGDNVEVIDDRTCRDITFETLTRILYERIRRYYNSGGKLTPTEPFEPGILIKLIRHVPHHWSDHE
jgi:polyhydroxyalkanoate synthesis regulator protein